MKTCTKSLAFPTARFYRLSDQMLQMLYGLFDETSLTIQWNQLFSAYTNEKLTKTPASECRSSSRIWTTCDCFSTVHGITRRYRHRRWRLGRRVQYRTSGNTFYQLVSRASAFAVRTKALDNHRHAYVYVKSTQSDDKRPNGWGRLEVTDAGPSACCLSRKEWTSPPRRGSSSGSRRPPRLRLRATIANANEFVNGVGKSAEARRLQRLPGLDVHHGFGNRLDPYLLSEVGQNAEEVLIHVLDEKRVWTLRLTLFFLKTVKSEKYDYVTLLPDAVLIPHDHRANVFRSGKEVPPIRCIMWKTASVRQIFHSGMLIEKGCVGDVEEFGKDFASTYQGCAHHVEEGWVDGCQVCDLDMLCWTGAFSREAVGKSGTSLKLQKNFATWSHNMEVLHATSVEEWERGCKQYAFKSEFQLCRWG